MILIKEVMVNMNTKQNTRTHTSFSSPFLILWHRVAVWGKFPLPDALKSALILDLKCWFKYFNILSKSYIKKKEKKSVFIIVNEKNWEMK